MHARSLLAATLAALALALPPAGAAPGAALVLTDPAGDANFSGLHGGAVAAGSQTSFDLTKVVLDTVRSPSVQVVRGRRIRVWTPTALQLTLSLAGAPGAQPTASYGINAEHATCGRLRLQVFYGAGGPQTFGDLARCGDDQNAVNPGQVEVRFTARVVGTQIVFLVPLQGLPRKVGVGSVFQGVRAYTSTAEPVTGYQPPDFADDAGIDTVVGTKSWKIA